jgi:CubicO group peptidase (beta-lactamase class C family)
VFKTLARLAAVITFFWAASLSAAPALDKANLDPWLDGFMTNALRVNVVEGAVVVVVKDGKILTQKGYGYADAAKRIPVDPENTIFRPGSISKLFVWTAVMQLSEQGKIDLDADINTYLDFKIIGKAGAKITVRHLMTHRAGFEDYGKSGILSDPSQRQPLRQWLMRYTPKRIFAPGSTPAYSNYGTSVAGYIVQRVSGMPFETYVERNIFAPLGMKHSSFRQPLPKSLSPFMSQGYDLAGGEAEPFEVLNGVSGILSASSGDMARFMIAHLNAERVTDGKLFKPDTAKLMYRTVVKNFPRLNGMALGFYEMNTNGRRVLAHGGDLNWFHSDLSLFIDDGVGIYISMNSAGNDKMDIRTELFRAFADRYMPNAALDSTVEPKMARLHIEQVAGHYIGTRRLESSFARIVNLLGEVSVSEGEKGELLVSGGGQTKSFKEISPYLWREVGGKELLSASVKDGKPVAIALNSGAQTDELHPVRLAQSASWILPAFLAALFVLPIAIFALPIGALIRKHYRIAAVAAPEQMRIARLQGLGSAALIGSLIAWLVLIMPRVSSGFYYSDDTHIIVTQVISVVCAFVAFVCVILVAQGLKRTQQSWLKILLAVAWGTAMVFVIWFHYNFNMLKIGSGM